MSADEDRRVVQRAAFRVGALVAGASAVAVAVGVGILIAVLVTQARTEGGGHRGGPGGAGTGGAGIGDRFVVDLDDVLPWVVGLGVLGVVVLGLVGWAAARWSVRPLDEALRRQRAFVSDASHELRTPLTALTSRIQIVQRRLHRGEPADEPLDQLRRDAQIMDDVLADMLLTAEGQVHTGTARVDDSVRTATDALASLATTRVCACAPAADERARRGTRGHRRAHVHGPHRQRDRTRARGLRRDDHRRRRRP